MMEVPPLEALREIAERLCKGGQAEQTNLGT